MLGAIIGDMVGSLYEFGSSKTRDFNIFNPNMRMTDDSLLTLAVAHVLMKHYPIKYDDESLKNIQTDLINEFVKIWNNNRNAGWGGMFYQWAQQAYRGNPKPYNSFGNGSAMRISPVGWVANSEEEVKKLSKTVTEITHNHPEGIKGAEAVAMAIYLARKGCSRSEILKRIKKDYYPQVNNHDFQEVLGDGSLSDCICQISVPVAFFHFFSSLSFEETIRSAVYYGGDSDTIAAIAGSIAEAYYNKDKVSKFEDKFLYLMVDPAVEKLIKDFHKTIGSHKFE